jgi:mono/diheme cytochrome c family protein
MIRTISFAGLLGTLLVSQMLLAESLMPPAGYKPDKKTKRLYESKCASCHGDDGRAKTETGLEMGVEDMTKPAYWKDLTLEGARKSVLEGIKRTHQGKEQEMKPFKDRLSTEQVDALIIYSSSFKK